MILLSETTIVSSFVAENQSCQDKDIGNQKPKTEIEIECPCALSLALFILLCLLFEETRTSSSTNIRVDMGYMIPTL